MSKPIATPTSFAGTTPPWQLNLLDANDANAANAINDLLTYENSFIDIGTVNNIVLSLPALLNASLAYGLGLTILVGNTNTSQAVTLTLGSLAAAPIKCQDGSSPQIGQIAAGSVIKVVFDGANFQMQGQSGEMWGTALSIAGAGAIVNLTGLINITPAANTNIVLNGPATVNDDAGAAQRVGFLGFPQHIIGGNYTTVLSDRHKSIWCQIAAPITVTLGPQSAGWALGDVHLVVNTNTGNVVTLAPSTGETLIWNGVSGNRALGAAGCAILYRAATNAWFIIGGTNIS